jgi:hypothetical protein
MTGTPADLNESELQKVIGFQHTAVALRASLGLLTIMVGAFKDGVQAQDFAQVVEAMSKNDELKKALLDAYNNVDKVKSEVKDLSAMEIIELLPIISPELVRVWQALSK